jgi:hypothetical protein
MRNGGFGALIAFTVAIVMFNGGGAQSTSTAAGPANSAALPQISKLRPPTAAKPVAQVLEQGICKLQPPNYTSCDSCEGFCPADDIRNAIKAFFVAPTAPGTLSARDSSSELSAPPASGKQDGDDDLKAHWFVPPDVRGHLKFVIASIPDPTHTHLSLLTDRVLEAIIEGAQAYDYLFARSSLPWVSQSFPESDDYLTRLNASAWQSAREKIPGLLIFRNAEPKDRMQSKEILFVFIVGELPTGGLNKQQFQSALQIMTQIRKGQEEQIKNPPLLILGPNFSGSLYSLDYLLEHDPTGLNPPVIVHSGGVTSYATVQWFMNFPRTRKLDFRTFLESDDYQLARFMAYAVCEEHYLPEDVVIIEEDETAYGSRHRRSPPDLASNPWASAPTHFNSGCNDKVDFSKIASIFYPRDISHVRSAYQQQTQTAAASDAGKRPPRTNLAINIEDTGSDDDSVPTYSPGQTPLSEESVLLGIVSSLHKQHAKFVILKATNTLDEIFLSQYLLRAYPEGRIVTFDEDLLLSREVADPRFQGILSVTPYPLFPGTRDDVALPKCPHLDSSRHEFPWDGSVGTFNAMVALLAVSKLPANQAMGPWKQCPSGKSPGKCADLPPAQYAEYGWPAIGQDDGEPLLAPPLWLTVIGNDGFWPLAILDNQQYLQHGGAPDSVLHGIHGDSSLAVLNPGKLGPWEILCLVFVAVAVIYTLLRWTGSISDHTEIAAYFALVENSFCSYGLLVADAMLFSVLLLLLSAWQYSQFVSVDFRLGKLLWCVFALLLVSAVVDQIRRKSYWSAFISFVFVLVLKIAVDVWVDLDLTHQSSRNISFYRFVHITSGVSPLIPFLILALAGSWYAWHTLAGLVLFDQRGPRLPEASDFGKMPDKDASALAAIRIRLLSGDRNGVLLKVIHPTNADLRVILLPVLALVLCLSLIDVSHPLRSIENQSYDWIYLVASVIVLFVLICDLSRLVVVWTEFRALLGVLDHLPLRRGFSRLNDLKGKSLWQLGGSAFGDFFSIIGRELDTLGKLKKFIPKEKAELASLWQAIETADVVVSLMRPALPSNQGAESKNDSDSHNFAGRVRRWSKTWFELFWWGRNPGLLPLLIAVHWILAHACAEVLLFLVPRWLAETEARGQLPEPPELTSESRLKKSVLPQSTELAEDFVCLFYYNFISSVFLRLRSILMSVAGMFVLLVLSFSSYPFEPKSSYHTLMTCVLILIVVLVAIVMRQMHRDPTLSRITNTAPGEVGWTFWFRMASFVALPLFTLLASRFPEIGGLLFFWAQPALNTFK